MADKKFFIEHSELREELQRVVKQNNGGYGFHMWATIVDRDGVVQMVVFSGKNRGEQWPGGRVISAQKAYTANAFSLPIFALSTANLFSSVQPGGSLYGLQFSSPVDTEAAYKGPYEDIGTEKDPMVGHIIGGINIFGGGLALYNSRKELIGGIGVSGDSSCADHNIAWKLRHNIRLDYVPKGVSPTKDDNLIYDIMDGRSVGGWGHPGCTPEALEIGRHLPNSHPAR
jgi:uncharacterized protein GlcG (DUF336 family)